MRRITALFALTVLSLLLGRRQHTSHADLITLCASSETRPLSRCFSNSAIALWSGSEHSLMAMSIVRRCNSL
jgi:hypothetical protein